MSTDSTPQLFADFPSSFAGPKLRPGDEGYASSRTIWNMRRADVPALIVQPLDVDDVVTAVTYARDTGVPVAVRSGGHGVDGAAMPHDALVIDMSRLKRVTVDTEAGQATLEAGVLLGEMDAALQEHGLAVPAGVVSDTGVAGLTLGGGVGHLTRRLGATVDSLVSVDVVTTDGQVTTASADSNPELFWGLRGAGHNLAIATSFTFTAHAIGPQVMSGMLIFSPDDAVTLCSQVDDIMSRAPRELSLPLIFAPAPPLPGLPPEAIGQPILIAVVIYTGPLESYDDAVGEVLSLVTPLANLVRPMSWIETNSMLDAFQPVGRRYQSKGAYVSAMSADLARLAIQRVAAAPAATPTASCLVGFPMLGGALLDVEEDATAFSRVGATWVSEIVAMWDSETNDETYLDWVEESLASLVPHSPGTGYVNLTADQGPAWLRTVYGSPEKWARLVALKKEWDPHNVLAYNKNIALAAVPEPA